jgi:hypothetical protein
MKMATETRCEYCGDGPAVQPGKTMVCASEVGPDGARTDHWLHVDCLKPFLDANPHILEYPPRQRRTD